MVLIEYGSNNNRLRVREKVDWMVYYFHCKHLHQRILREIQSFYDPQQ